MADYSTLEGRLLYKVDYGGPEAAIHTAYSYGPITTPYVHSVETEKLVFKWNIGWSGGLSNNDPGKAPNWLKLHLFQAKDPNEDPPDPPNSVSGVMVTGAGVTLEDSDLWKFHISQYYTPVAGVETIAHSYDDLAQDRTNISWPGHRRSHLSHYVGLLEDIGFILVDPIPLRVSATLVEEGTRTFLLLTEIKRGRRLQLNPFQFKTQYLPVETRTSVWERLIRGDLSIAAKYNLSIEEVEREAKGKPNGP